MEKHNDKGQRLFLDSEECVIRNVLNGLGDRWTLLVLFTLMDGPQRFSEIRRRIENISQRMLTQALRKLERDGLITRTAFAEVPVRVSYELTEMGETSLKPLLSLVDWAQDHFKDINKARKVYDNKST